MASKSFKFMFGGNSTSPKSLKLQSIQPKSKLGLRGFYMKSLRLDSMLKPCWQMLILPTENSTLKSYVVDTWDHRFRTLRRKTLGCSSSLTVSTFLRTCTTIFWTISNLSAPILKVKRYQLTLRTWRVCTKWRLESPSRWPTNCPIKSSPRSQ